MWEDFAEPSKAEEFLGRYGPGATVTGFKKGSEITLTRTPLWHFPLYLIPFTWLVFALGKARIYLKARHDAHIQTDKTVSSGRKAPTFDQSAAVPLEDVSQQVEWKRMFGSEISPNISGLKPRRAQLIQFIGILAGALILSGVTVFASFSAYKTWKSGQTAGCAVAAAPFLALATLGSIRRAITQLLGLLNPRPYVQSGSQSVWPGGFLDLTWRYEGKIGTARKIIFSLIGSEKIEIKEQSRGTYKYSKESGSSKKVPLHECSQAYEIREGRARVKIPENIMHSFHYGSIKIEWMLKVEVQIGFWADLHEEYAIQVRPLPLSAAT